MTEHLEEAWHRDGWCVVEGAIPPEDLAGAQDALKRLFPSAEEMDRGVDDERDGPLAHMGRGLAGVPVPQRPPQPDRGPRRGHRPRRASPRDRDVRLYLALLSAKYADQPSGYNQLLHTDYPNHSLVVPRREPGYQQLELFIYLNDVSASNGATRMVSRTRHG